MLRAEHAHSKALSNGRQRHVYCMQTHAALVLTTYKVIDQNSSGRGAVAPNSEVSQTVRRGQGQHTRREDLLPFCSHAFKDYVKIRHGFGCIHVVGESTAKQLQ